MTEYKMYTTDAISSITLTREEYVIAKTILNAGKGAITIINDDNVCVTYPEREIRKLVKYKNEKI